MAADLPDLFAAEGVSATYAPAGGSAKTCRVIIHYNYASEPAGASVSKHQQVKVIDALISETGKLPVRPETFTVGSATYTVQTAWLEEDGLVARAVVI
jgi:hypothetical protein